MYVMSRRMCKLLVNVVANPWECLTKYKPDSMCQQLRNILHEIGGDFYLDVISHPVMNEDGVVHRTYITVMSKDPELVIGVVDRVVLKDMILELFFTDRFGDNLAFNSVTFRTTGTEGLTLDSKSGWL